MITSLHPILVTKDLLRRHHVLVDSDNAFQRSARLLQALWREEQGLPVGERHPGVPLGSRIPVKLGSATASNLMTAAAQHAARDEVKRMLGGSGQKIAEDRLWANLLSSQPLAFSLFADLATELGTATNVFRRLWPNRIATVTAIRFEYSPGRADPKYTNDRTAFDVYIEHTTANGSRGFIGIEVKYHESLNDAPARHRARYDELTTAMGCFKPERVSGLRRKPIEQLWRDHMLVGSMLLDERAPWRSGLYAFLYPQANAACARATAKYADHLSDDSTFSAVTLETFLDALEAESQWPWVARLRDRYFGWTKIERAAACWNS